MSQCPECGSADTVRVWEYPRLYEAGMPPKFVGCTACSTMVRNN